jgi:hypothetical protein
MHLEHALRQIQTDRRNLHVDGPLGDSFQQLPYGTSMPGPGAVHLIKSGTRNHLDLQLSQLLSVSFGTASPAVESAQQAMASRSTLN